MNTIPELERFCGSWTIVSKETGEGVFETFERKTAEAVNQEKYEVLTTYQYLVNMNKKIRDNMNKKIRDNMNKKIREANEK